MTPKVSIIVPYHDFPEASFFLKRNIDSIMAQDYKNYEIVLVKEGKMAHNTNRGILRATGDIIKILFLDDYFAHPQALRNIVSNFSGGWLVTGCNHDNGTEVGNPHLPTWNDQIYTGNNTIGSPSVVAFESKDPFLFDESLSWMLDCDLYWKMYHKYGEPKLLNDINVTIGIGRHQTTHTMSEEEKQKEVAYVINKYKNQDAN